MSAWALRLNNSAASAKAQTKNCSQSRSDLPPDFQTILLPRYGRHRNGEGAVSGELRKEITRYADHFYCT